MAGGSFAARSRAAAASGIRQSADQTASRAHDVPGEEEPRHGDDVVARSPLRRTLRARSELSGRGLHPTQSEREYRACGIYRVLYEDRPETYESHSENHAGGEYAGRIRC